MGGWSEYFFLVGSAAAFLIGLMFVVDTLTAGRDRNENEADKKLYTTLIGWHLRVVVVLSGGTVAPVVGMFWLGTGMLAAGALGIAYSLYITAGILHSQLATSFSGYDALWYGVAPGLIYAAVEVCGWAMLRGDECGQQWRARWGMMRIRMQDINHAC